MSNFNIYLNANELDPCQHPHQPDFPTPITLPQSPKTEEFFNVINRSIVTPLKTPAFTESCFATLMLVFPAIDALGKLTDDNTNAGAGTRFKNFLARLGNRYSSVKDNLWKLRCSLLHNGINVAAFLSKLNDSHEFHLQTTTNRKQLMINTRTLAQDFCVAFETLQDEVRHDRNLASRCEARLAFVTDEIHGDWPCQSTRPPGIDFTTEHVVTK